MTATEPRTIQELARFAYDHMEQRTRDNGDKFWVRTDDAPEWLNELCHEAHGDMFPDDTRYEMIVDALATISDSDDPEEAEYEIEADPYTSQLTGWLHSRTDRYQYVDEAISEYGQFDNLIAALSAGQVQEKREVYRSVLDSLTELSESLEDEDTDEDA